MSLQTSTLPKNHLQLTHNRRNQHPLPRSTNSPSSQSHSNSTAQSNNNTTNKNGKHAPFKSSYLLTTQLQSSTILLNPSLSPHQSTTHTPSPFQSPFQLPFQFPFPFSFPFSQAQYTHTHHGYTQTHPEKSKPHHSTTPVTRELHPTSGYSSNLPTFSIPAFTVIN